MHKLRSKSALITFSGTVLILLAAACSVLLIIVQIESVMSRYETLQKNLLEVEQRIASIQQWWIVLVIVFILFTVKSFLPIFPLSAVCFITGIVLPSYISLPVNLVGVGWLMSIRYFWGAHLGGGGVKKIIRLNESIRNFMEHGGTGNPYMLFALRLIPSIPVNSVSQLYGAMKFKYTKYILISLAGFSYKLLTYTIIGRNVFNPLSASFLVPIIILLLISGSLLIGFNYIIELITKKQVRRENK
ncbi:MAG: hypothetical protein FWF05_09255 [Oscillospiraceae bacterium]|nr:hypothetical protein [Oscillospiraceae bacterium]